MICTCSVLLFPKTILITHYIDSFDIGTTIEAYNQQSLQTQEYIETQNTNNSILCSSQTEESSEQNFNEQILNEDSRHSPPKIPEQISYSENESIPEFVEQSEEDIEYKTCEDMDHYTTSYASNSNSYDEAQQNTCLRSNNETENKHSNGKLEPYWQYKPIISSDKNNSWKPSSKISNESSKPEFGFAFNNTDVNVVENSFSKSTSSLLTLQSANFLSKGHFVADRAKSPLPIFIPESHSLPDEPEENLTVSIQPIIQYTVEEVRDPANEDHVREMVLSGNKEKRRVLQGQKCCFAELQEIEDAYRSANNPLSGTFKGNSRPLERVHAFTPVAHPRLEEYVDNDFHPEERESSKAYLEKPFENDPVSLADEIESEEDIKKTDELIHSGDISDKGNNSAIAETEDVESTSQLMNSEKDDSFGQTMQKDESPQEANVANKIEMKSIEENLAQQKTSRNQMRQNQIEENIRISKPMCKKAPEAVIGARPLFGQLDINKEFLKAFTGKEKLMKTRKNREIFQCTQKASAPSRIEQGVYVTDSGYNHNSSFVSDRNENNSVVRTEAAAAMEGREEKIIIGDSGEHSKISSRFQNDQKANIEILRPNETEEIEKIYYQRERALSIDFQTIGDGLQQSDLQAIIDKELSKVTSISSNDAYQKCLSEVNQHQDTKNVVTSESDIPLYANEGKYGYNDEEEYRKVPVRSIIENFEQNSMPPLKIKEQNYPLSETEKAKFYNSTSSSHSVINHEQKQYHDNSVQYFNESATIENQQTANGRTQVLQSSLQSAFQGDKQMYAVPTQNYRTENLQEYNVGSQKTSNDGRLLLQNEEKNKQEIFQHSENSFFRQYDQQGISSQSDISGCSYFAETKMHSAFSNYEELPPGKLSELICMIPQ